jgi:hypothetical protein
MYVIYMAGSNEITRHLWDIVQGSDTTAKEKTNALACLMQSYNSHLQILTSGSESYMNIKKFNEKYNSMGEKRYLSF